MHSRKIPRYGVHCEFEGVTANVMRDPVPASDAAGRGADILAELIECHPDVIRLNQNGADFKPCDLRRRE